MQLTYSEVSLQVRTRVFPSAVCLRAGPQVLLLPKLELPRGMASQEAFKLLVACPGGVGPAGLLLALSQRGNHELLPHHRPEVKGQWMGGQDLSNLFPL